MRQIKGRRKKGIKLLAIFSILLIMFSLIYFFEKEMLKSVKHNIDSIRNDISNKLKEIDSKNEQVDLTKINIYNKQIEINSTNEQLNLKESQLEKNSSDLQQLKSGDEYHLHDPIFKEVKEFIQRDYSTNELTLVENAKNQGIRCAYVLVYAGSSGMYPLVGFNTLDKGMVYFEAKTDYRVTPEIGKSYTSCVVDNPYVPSVGLITDILPIW